MTAAQTYFIAMGWPGPVKIGRSTNPLRRLGELQIGCPHKLYLIATCEEVEATLHNVFGARRKRGEWFEPDDELMDWIESLASFQTPPVKSAE